MTTHLLHVATFFWCWICQNTWQEHYDHFPIYTCQMSDWYSMGKFPSNIVRTSVSTYLCSLPIYTFKLFHVCGLNTWITFNFVITSTSLKKASKSHALAGSDSRRLAKIGVMSNFSPLEIEISQIYVLYEQNAELVDECSITPGWPIIYSYTASTNKITILLHWNTRFSA